MLQPLMASWPDMHIGIFVLEGLDIIFGPTDFRSKMLPALIYCPTDLGMCSHASPSG